MARRTSTHQKRCRRPHLCVNSPERPCCWSCSSCDGSRTEELVPHGALGLTFNLIALRCGFLVASRLGARRSILAQIVLRTLGSGPRGVRLCFAARHRALGEKKRVFFHLREPWSHSTPSVCCGLDLPCGRKSRARAPALRCATKRRCSPRSDWHRMLGRHARKTGPHVTSANII